MTLSLLLEEIRSGWTQRGWRLAFSLALKLLAAGLFMLLVGYLFWGLDAKLRSFSDYGTYDFLVLYLFLATLASSLASLPASYRALERPEDRLILSSLPISRDERILAKAAFFYTKLVVSLFLLSFPALVAYGIARGQTAIYYVFSALYPALASFSSLGLLTMLLGPYGLLMEVMRRHKVLQFALASVLVVGLCFVYREVLNLFLDLLAGSELDSYFSEPFLRSLNGASPYLFPAGSYLALLTGDGNAAGQVSLFLGASLLLLVLGFYILSFLMGRLEKGRKEKGARGARPARLPRSRMLSLLKKEWVLLFRDSSYLFSYTSLLIMQPFLAFVVIESLSGILQDGMGMFLAYFPELINGVLIFLVLLFASLISGASADGVSREGSGRILMKEIPVPPGEQLLAKLLVSTSVSLVSLLVTSLVLLGFSLLPVHVFFSILGTGSLFIVSLNLLGALDDFRRLGEGGRGGVSLLALYSILLPVLLALLHFLMTFLGVAVPLLYLVEFLIPLLLMGALLLLLRWRLPSLFLRMRVDYV